ncbi:hypothetical protein LELG_01585 [Lodderomyces elongisporus NRRL YB-4239]|uniref:Cyclin-like domain-containing protein n=1 Tax=Lodderomyces elongisporus (strain ATCC 11503 / CBS 2605 / JCM 1781 / NBRC 1676 / NRRL YB-4239) TaxID=379508 RepID=A5DW49_LODEL|nr:hypothetical protein LELG_01585 [Lodderomyces elongisporus NRRL YB-4239]
MTEQLHDTKEDSPVRKKQRISADDLYRRSTQFEMWSFTPDQLAHAKITANTKGQNLASAKFQEAYKLAKLQNPQVFQDNALELSEENLLNLLSPEEESTYLDFYIQNITTTCNFFKMPTQVKLTAASFFKKFYIVNSVMEFHPKNVLYTCIFLAAKSENYFISIDSFVKALKGVEKTDILSLEFILLQSLKFTLLVHHPMRPLYGFFLDFQAELLHPDPVMYDVSVDTIGKLYNSAKEWLNKYYMFSDVGFLFAPPHIALAAMYDIDRRITDRYLKRKFLKHEKSEDRDNKERKEKKENKENGTNENQSMKHEADGKMTNDANSDPLPNEQNRSLENAEKAVEINGVETAKILPGREQYETLVRSIRKCIKLAREMPVADRERSKEIDRKCFFALNPKKLIDKRIKKLTTPPAEKTDL